MKTVTMRVDDSVYDMIKLAAGGQKLVIKDLVLYTNKKLGKA